MKLGIVGATGAVGEELIRCLHDFKIQYDELRLFASNRSKGKIIKTPREEITVEDLSETVFNCFDYLIFAAGGEVSKKYIPKAIEKGARVIDCSSAFRYHSDVPLILFEANIDKAKNAKLIANPNCTTAIAAVALYPLHKRFSIKKAIISTYQASSGAGAKGMDELISGTRNHIDGKKHQNNIFPHPLPFNVIPRIDELQDNGYTKEEMKVSWEMKKIFDDDSMEISCTAVRVPVLRSHSESITIETVSEISPDEVREILKKSHGVKLIDKPRLDRYPMPINTTGKFDIEVGRIRQSSIFKKHGIDLFVSGDQLLKGAALNAVQVLNYLVNQPK